MPNTARESSPLAIDDDENRRVLKSFFKWMRERHHNPDFKDAIDEVKNVIIQNFWTIDDLKQMSDPSSMAYKRAVEWGIPDGLMRNFKKDLQIFKPLYRNEISKQYRAAIRAVAANQERDNQRNRDREEEAIQALGVEDNDEEEDSDGDEGGE